MFRDYWSHNAWRQPFDGTCLIVGKVASNERSNNGQKCVHYSLIL